MHSTLHVRTHVVHALQRIHFKAIRYTVQVVRIYGVVESRITHVTVPSGPLCRSRTTLLCYVFYLFLSVISEVAMSVAYATCHSTYESAFVYHAPHYTCTNAPSKSHSRHSETQRVCRCGWAKGLRGIGGLPAGGVRGANLMRGAVGRIGVGGLYPRRA